MTVEQLKKHTLVACKECGRYPLHIGEKCACGGFGVDISVTHTTPKPTTKRKRSKNKMKTTQRIRFKQIDVLQGIEWATPIGTVTFTQSCSDDRVDFLNGQLTVNCYGLKFCFANARYAIQWLNRTIKEKIEVHYE